MAIVFSETAQYRSRLATPIARSLTLNEALAAFDQRLANRVHGSLHARHVGILSQRAFKVFQRPREVMLVHINLAVARQYAEVPGIPLQDLIAILQRQVILAHQKINRRAL